MVDEQPQDLVLGPDGNIWFAERGTSKVGRISASNPGTIDEFPTKNAGAAPDILTVGPDGNIWFTELNGNSIGRINPAAPLAPDSFGGLGLQSPRGIAVGPDGNLWVTDAGAPTEVVIVSPAGAKVDDVPLPTDFDPRNIARGPDNNMWVAGFNSKNFARITTTGTPAVDPPAGYPAPGGVTPMDIIAGGDGNLWYTAQGTTVGRLTTTGEATNFTSKGVDPFGITIGPDGAVWFAEFQQNAVGRVDFAGNTTNVTGMTAPAGPRYVTGGPGDSLWFTEEFGNRIGRVIGIELPQTGGPGPGPGPGPGTGTPDTTRPNVTRFRITRSVFRLGGLGTVIRWRQSEAARNTIVFHRRVDGRWRRVPRRRMRFQATAGAHRLRFRGRVSLRKPLRPGRYRMTMTARDAAGNVSIPDRVRFRLLPRLRR
jgi:streptogramin lyase